MTTPTALFVPGIPRPQGSAKAFVVAGRAVVTHDNTRLIPWRGRIAAGIRAEHGPGIYHPDGPVTVTAEFVLPRVKAEPKSRTRPHTRKPDVDKLARGLLDAMTQLVFDDDSQVVRLDVTKRSAEPGEEPGVFVAWFTQDARTAPGRYDGMGETAQGISGRFPGGAA